MRTGRKLWVERRMARTLLIFGALLIAAGFVVTYVLQVRAYRHLVAEAFRHSAVELATSISLDIKVQNLPGIQRLMSNSYLATRAEWLELVDVNQQLLFRYPDREIDVRQCAGQLGEVPVHYDHVRVGAVKYCVRGSDDAKMALSWNVFLSIVLAMVVIAVIFFIWFRRQTRGVSSLLDALDNVDIENPVLPEYPSRYPLEEDLEHIYRKVRLLITRLRETSSENLRKEKELIFIDVCRQVAHDIRSPLTALQVALSGAKGMEENTRVLVRAAADRISDIANALVAKRSVKITTKALTEESTTATETVLVASAIELIVAEKRLLLKNSDGPVIEWNPTPDCYADFVAINPSDLKRVVSNIVNNSCEAVRANGVVTVTQRSDAENVFISVIDNGCGIPPDLLSKVFDKGFSRGKTEGSGLGLHHANELVKQSRGEIKIESEEWKGTRVCIRIPRSAAPDWFLKKLMVPPSGTILVVDDDPSVHAAWNERFSASGAADVTSRIVNLKDVRSFFDFIGNNALMKDLSLALIDFEFMGETLTGLDLIESLPRYLPVVLVTGRFEEASVQRGCNRIGRRMIPKSLVTIVPLEPPQSIGKGG